MRKSRARGAPAKGSSGQSFDGLHHRLQSLTQDLEAPGIGVDVEGIHHLLPDRAGLIGAGVGMQMQPLLGTQCAVAPGCRSTAEKKAIGETRAAPGSPLPESAAARFPGCSSHWQLHCPHRAANAPAVARGAMHDKRG